jgi:hypothetical protein
MGGFVSAKPLCSVPPVEPEPAPDPEDDPPELEPPELDPPLPAPLPAEPLPGCELLAPGEFGSFAVGVLRLEAEFPPVAPQPITTNGNENSAKMARTTSGLQRMGPQTTVKREQVLWFD